MTPTLRSGKSTLEGTGQDAGSTEPPARPSTVPPSANAAAADDHSPVQMLSHDSSSDSEALNADLLKQLQRELRAERRRNRKLQDALIASMEVPVTKQALTVESDTPSEKATTQQGSMQGAAQQGSEQGPQQGATHSAEYRSSASNVTMQGQTPPLQLQQPAIIMNTEYSRASFGQQPAQTSAQGALHIPAASNQPDCPQMEFGNTAANNTYATFPSPDDTARHTQDWVNNGAEQSSPANPFTQFAAIMTEAFRASQNGATPRQQPEEENRLASLIARQSSAKDLPPYYGDAVEWPAWRAQFYQSTSTCGMTQSENLMRLQRALKGKAREAVSPLLMDPTQVSEIMDVLEHRFGGAHTIATLMFEKIKKLPRLPEDASNDALIEFSGTVQNVVASLGSLKYDYLSNPALLSEISSKMPLVLRVSWLDKIADQVTSATIQQLAAFLKRLTNAIPRSGLVDNVRAPVKPRREQVFAQSDSKIEKCAQCANSHKIRECPVFLEKSVPGRWEKVKSARICQKCLEVSHHTRACKYRVWCGVGSCRLPHHKLLHDPSRVNSSAGTSRGNNDNQTVTNTTRYGEDSVLLKVIPVTICGPNGHVSIHALLDEGSTVTLLDTEIADKVGASGPTRGLRIHGASGMCASDKTSRRVKLSVRGDGKEYGITANTVRNLDLPQQTIAGRRQVKPQILLGQDNAHLIVSREVREDTEKRILSRTALGWITHGGIHPTEHITLNIIGEIQRGDQQLSDLLKQNFAIDSLGVTSVARTDATIQRAEALMENTTRPYDTGRWETGLLWKADNTRLPDNKQCALKRLYSLEKKLGKDEALAAAYKVKINSLIERGYARKLNHQEAATPKPRKWYLPHFAVINPNKPGKLRVVFDAASRCRGVSLNDQLLTGPDLLSSLLGNILRFREGKIAFAADIAEMFLQIKIKSEDQSSQLFMWRTTPQEEPSTYMLTSMMFGATCSPSSAQFVRNKVAEQYQEQYTAAARAIQEKFYMDDYLDAVDTSDEAAKMIQEVSTILASGGFQLTNWASNDPAAIAKVPLEKRAKSAIPISGGDHENERILGLIWDPAGDHFIYSFREAAAAEIIPHPTKRQLLSIVMKIFDPVGFVSCLTIRSKILLQAVWRSNIGWDERIKTEHLNKWSDWLQFLRQSCVTIPRRCLSNKNGIFELHMFCDASESACCTIAYLTEKSQERTHSTFLASKCKVAPLKPLSIPRLELQAALMAARLAATIKKESQLKISRTTYWTDSTTVLCWLRTDPRAYSAFVANRLGEIDELTEIINWRWVPTKLNPADIGTRDIETPDLTPTGPWFCGPTFINQPEAAWPREKEPVIRPDNQALEVRPQYVGLTTTMGDGLPLIERFSSWHRLIRTTAWVLRFIRRCRPSSETASEGPLRAEETQEAEILWVKKSQAHSFGAEIHATQKGDIPPAGSRLRTLTPFLGPDGIIRMGSRLQALKDVTSGVQTPVILDGDETYARLLIRHYHQKADHSSTEKTMAEIRGSFFILKLRTNLRRIAHECLVCRIRNAKPMPPLMGPLPAARLAHHVSPFTHCGLDYFGPMEVTIGRRREKRYGALFTCLSTRAVHLELVASLSADSAIMAMQRMSARRGQPECMYSDNGTNFHGAEKEIRDALESISQDPRVQNYISTQKTSWKFIPPLSPHMGGAWERLVRSIKRALKSTMKERSPKEETLLTALAEAEYIVNNRPLTHVSVDPRDEEPLTPNHFLLGSAGKRPHLSLYAAKEEEVCLRKQWRISQQLADMFWRRWIKEYLPTIAARQKWHQPITPIKTGDLVLVVDPALPRNSWPRGRIIETMPAADGQVRAVRVQTSTGVYVRPAVKIAVLMTTPISEEPPRSLDGIHRTDTAGRKNPVTF